MDTIAIVPQQEKETVHILGAVKESFVIKPGLCGHTFFLISVILITH